MVSLQDICLRITDGKHGDCQGEDGSGYYFISCKDVKDGRIDYSGARQITEADYHDTHRRTQLEPNDILITNSGTIGRMALVPNAPKTDRTTFQKSVAIIKPNQEKAFPKWLYYYLLANKDALIGWAGGTAQKNLLLRDLRAFQVNPPPFPTQRKIAAILSAYDDLNENNQRRIKILEEIAQSIYTEWFVHFKYPKHEKTEIIQTPHGTAPKGWEIRTLSEVCEVIQSGGTPSRREMSYWQNGTIDWFKTKELNDSFLFSSEEKITEEGLRNSSARLFDEGTILMAMYAAPTVGRLGILTSRASCNQAALGLRANANWLTQHFLFFTLKNLRNYFYSISLGVAQQNINAIKVKETQFLLPEYSLIEKFDSIIGSLMDEIKLLNQQNKTLERCRDILLPRLISGQIDVSELDVPSD